MARAIPIDTWMVVRGKDRRCSTRSLSTHRKLKQSKNATAATDRWCSRATSPASRSSLSPNGWDVQLACHRDLGYCLVSKATREEDR